MAQRSRSKQRTPEVVRTRPREMAEFKARYKAELKHNAAQLALLKQAISKGPATLLYGAKDTEHNEAVVLQDLLNR